MTSSSGPAASSAARTAGPAMAGRFLVGITMLMRTAIPSKNLFGALAPCKTLRSRGLRRPLPTPSTRRHTPQIRGRPVGHLHSGQRLVEHEGRRLEGELGVPRSELARRRRRVVGAPERVPSRNGGKALHHAIGGDNIRTNAHHRRVSAQLSADMRLRMVRVQDHEDALSLADRRSRFLDDARIDRASFDQTDETGELVGLDGSSIVRAYLDVDSDDTTAP